MLHCDTLVSTSVPAHRQQALWDTNVNNTRNTTTISLFTQIESTVYTHQCSLSFLHSYTDSGDDNFQQLHVGLWRAHTSCAIHPTEQINVI